MSAAHRRRASRRRIYWAWRAHLEEGLLVLLESKRRRDRVARRRMVRVRIEIL